MTSIIKYSNPYAKSIRDLLNCLMISDNEFQRINFKLRKTEKDLKQSIDTNIFHRPVLRTLDCASEDRLNDFKTNVENISNVAESFEKHVKEIQIDRKNIIDESKNHFKQYNVEKKNFIQFHNKAVNNLQSVASQSHDPELVIKCAKVVRVISEDFANEILYIQKSENVLFSFFQMLHGKSVPYYNEYEWQCQTKDTINIENIAKEIKNKMGTTLRAAYANLHIHQPLDKDRCLIQYLLKTDRNEEVLKEKLQRFTNK